MLMNNIWLHVLKTLMVCIKTHLDCMYLSMELDYDAHLNVCINVTCFGCVIVFTCGYRNDIFFILKINKL